jgi:hypothetical protein
MARDVFVYWSEQKPTRAELQRVLEDYLRGIATEIAWDQDRFFVTLPGSPSCPLARDEGTPEPLRRAVDTEHDGQPRPRWIEVWISPMDGAVDVMTRSMDEVTNAVAREFAAIIARRWRGRIEDGVTCSATAEMVKL